MTRRQFFALALLPLGVPSVKRRATARVDVAVDCAKIARDLKAKLKAELEPLIARHVKFVGVRLSREAAARLRT